MTPWFSLTRKHEGLTNTDRRHSSFTGGRLCHDAVWWTVVKKEQWFFLLEQPTRAPFAGTQYQISSFLHGSSFLSGSRRLLVTPQQPLDTVPDKMPASEYSLFPQICASSRAYRSGVPPRETYSSQ